MSAQRKRNLGGQKFETSGEKRTRISCKKEKHKRGEVREGISDEASEREEGCGKIKFFVFECWNQ